MAEAMLIGIAVALLQQAIPAAISKLKARFKQAKASEEETRELEDLLRSVHDCSTAYQNTCGGKVKTTTSSTTRSFTKSLKNVQKTLDSWSSQNSGFFSRSSADRVQEIQSLRRKLQDAIQVEIWGMLKDQQRVLNSILDHVKPGKAPTRHLPPPRVEAPKNQRSKSTERPSTNPSKSPALIRSRSKTVQRDQHPSIEKKRCTVDLWVSIDSEKQANDVVNKLQGLQDVKKVFCDLVTKKVSVKLREGSKVDIATLLSEIQNAQPKGKVAPTRWLQRPR